MSRIVGLFRRILRLSKPAESRIVLPPVPGRDLRFAEGDRVIIDGARLSRPLRCHQTFRGIQDDDIIGQAIAPLYLRSKEGRVHKIDYPSLEQYVSLTPRFVTPIYAAYATSIVSVLDLHVRPPDDDNDPLRTKQPRLELLEAGTGHGSLTIHLARAIAAANPAPLRAEKPELHSTPTEHVNSSSQNQRQGELLTQWAEWKETRRAILHSVDNRVTNRFHAEKLVRGFRHGLYWPHVEFYADAVEHWIRDQVERRQTSAAKSRHETGEFLSYVVLDLPSVHTRLRDVQRAMREGAKLVVFTPSVTQIGDCVRKIKEEKLPLVLEKVVELGEGISNGRRWDVRLVTPKKAKGSPGSPTQIAPGEESGIDDRIVDDPDNIEDVENASTTPDEAQVMVCRPMVGERIIGGGFIALWRKLSDRVARDEIEWRETRSGKEKSRR